MIMMAKAFSAVALCALVALARPALSLSSPNDGEYVPCSTGSSSELVTLGQTFGCDGYDNQAYWSFNFSYTSSDLAIQFLNFSTEGGYDHVYVSYAGTSYGPFSGSSVPQNGGVLLMPGSGTLSIVFQSDGSNTGTGFAAVVTYAPETINVATGVAAVATIDTAGFTYFKVLNHDGGTSLDVLLTVLSYQGLQSPSVFASLSNLPSLSQYDFTNDSTPVGSVFESQLSVPNPEPGYYYVGVFLYGPSAQVQVDVDYTYSQGFLPNARGVGPGVNVTVEPSAPQLFPLQLDAGSTQLTLEVSLRRGGGTLLVLLCASYECQPGDQNAVVALDTNQGTYQTATVCVDPEAGCSNAVSDSGFYLVTVIDSSAVEANGIIRTSWK